MKNIYKIILSVALPLACGAIAGLSTARNVKTWYLTLNRPSWAPPSWLFGPVWTTLYIMMGISFYIFWRAKPVAHWKNKGYTIYYIQLALNLAWSFLFFELKWMGVALFEIIVMWIAIFLTILVFSRVSKLSAWLLVPYIAWVSFASYLNYAFWYLNKLSAY